MSIIYKRLQNTHARCKWNSFECGNKVQRSQRLNLIQSLKEKPRQTVSVKRTDVHFCRRIGVRRRTWSGVDEVRNSLTSRSDEQADGIVVCFVVCRSSLHFCASLPSSTFNAQGDIGDGVTFSFRNDSLSFCLFCLESILCWDFFFFFWLGRNCCLVNVELTNLWIHDF